MPEGATSNLLGIHALVWTGGWTHEDCEMAVASTQEAGYDLIEIPALDPSRIDVEHTRATLEKYGVSAGLSLGLPLESDVNSEDAGSVARGREFLQTALDTAHRLGAGYLGGVLYGSLRKYPEPATMRARENSVAAIRELAQAAAPLGITVGLETVNRYETNLLNTAQATLDFIDDVGENNVVVHLDAYHMNIEEDGYRKPILQCGDRLGYFHIGESHRGYLGTGTIDFDEIFSALSDIDYTGPITFESFSSAVVDPQLSNTLAVWRNLWSDSMDLAVTARKFVAEQLRSH